MTTTTSDSVGRLYLDAQKRAQKKASGYTSKAPCGCAVTVTYFPGSALSHSTKFERCHEHPKPERS